MTSTVADDVFRQVSDLCAADGALSKAEAIRRVAADCGRTVSAVSSAYYSGARRARGAPSASGEDHTMGTEQGPGSPTLYAEMLPLVEAGASVEQAARRFGDGDEVAEIAAGFRRWHDLNGEDIAANTDALGQALRDAEQRIAALEDDNRRLRHELAQFRQAIDAAQTALDRVSD